MSSMTEPSTMARISAYMAGNKLKAAFEAEFCQKMAPKAMGFLKHGTSVDGPMDQ